MRILQVVPVFARAFGGPVTVVRSISKELAKKHEVTVYTTSALNQKHDFRDSPFEVELDGYHVVYFPRIRMFDGFNVSPTMARALKEALSEYNVVHLHSWRHFQDIIVHHYAKKYVVPYVLQVHGSLPRRRMAKKRLKWIYDMFFGYRLLRTASKVIALSQMEAGQYMSMGVSEEKIEIIPNGIDLSEYSNLPSKGSFRKKFSIDDDEKIVLYLGRIHRLKGIEFLTKSFARLVKDGIKETKLIIAGPDDGYLQEAKSLVSFMGISGKVIFTGLLSEKEKISAYVDSTIVVYPEKLNVFGLVPLEAAICGKPVIVSSENYIAKVVEEGSFGFSVRYDDVEGLVKAMHKMLSDDKLLGKLGERGRNFVSKNFSWDKITEKLEKVYEEVADVRAMTAVTRPLKVSYENLLP